MNKWLLLSSMILAVPFSASCNATTYSVTINSTHIASYKLSSPRAIRGKDLTVKFTAEKFYRVFEENILEVKVNNRLYPEGFGWTFSDKTSTLTVKGEIITNSVNITVEGVEAPFYIDVYPNGWETDKTLEEGGYYRAEVNQVYDAPILTVKDDTFDESCIESPAGLKFKIEENDGKNFYIDKDEFYRDFTVKFKAKA